MGSLQLGVTNVGDLLTKNSITKMKNGELLKPVTLRIPEYQRPYKWTSRNASVLLDDVYQALEENKEVYRVGTLILHEEEAKDEEGNTVTYYNIVDGQQRTITFALLLKVCVEWAKEQASKKSENFGEIIDIPFLNERIIKNSSNTHNILANYRILERRIKKIPRDEEFSNLYRYIRENCEFIVVITSDLSEAFQFFDSQNARGKALYPHDLLKAYHLREMRNLGEDETARIVETWEDMDQAKLSSLFSDYLYRVKEWVRGNRSFKLSEENIELFKGLSSHDTHPYAQFYKGAFAFAEEVVNNSNLPFVIGIQGLRPFQLDTPIIAGKPFFGYANHYFDVLADIQNNDRYEGHFINGNSIVATLNLPRNRNGVGNSITRLMFDTAVLLYVDRFCPSNPSRKDLENLERFVDYAFIWAYSLRAQYYSLGWREAENYIAGNPKKKGTRNAFNIYQVIANSESPSSLLGELAGLLVPLDSSRLKRGLRSGEDLSDKEEDGSYSHYQSHFKALNFVEGDLDEERQSNVEEYGDGEHQPSDGKLMEGPE